MRLFCGDTLCKAPVEANPGAPSPWPVRCEACGTSLYPSDVLERLPAADLDPKRATLMREDGGRRVAFVAGAVATPQGDDTLDRIFAMVDTGEPKSSGPPVWLLVLVALVLIALVVGALLTR